MFVPDKVKVPAPLFVRLPAPASTPATVNVVPEAGATVIPVLVVMVVPVEVFKLVRLIEVADKAPVVIVTEPPTAKDAAVNVVILTVPVWAVPLRPATESLNVTVFPLGIITAETLLKSGTAPVTLVLLVNAQFVGLNQSPVAPPTQVTDV